MKQSEVFLNLPKIGIIGLAKSGKSFATETLKQKFYFISFTVSDVIRDYAKGNNIQLLNRNDFWKTANQLEGKFGKDYLLKKSLEKLEQQVALDPNIKGVVLEGIRRYDVAEGLKKLPNSLLICIVAPYQIRFKRQRDFRLEDSIDTLDKFIQVESPEEAVFEKTKLLADITIINDQSKESFAKQIIEIVTARFFK